MKPDIDCMSFIVHDETKSQTKSKSPKRKANKKRSRGKVCVRSLGAVIRCIQMKREVHFPMVACSIVSYTHIHYLTFTATRIHTDRVFILNPWGLGHGTLSLCNLLLATYNTGLHSC